MTEKVTIASDEPERRSGANDGATPKEHAILLEWWHSLEQRRGDRAELRRATSIDQIFFNPAFHRLRRMLRGTRWTNPEGLARLAALSARVREYRPGASFPTQLGKPEKGKDKSPLSGLRFRRLLQAREADELLQLTGRAISLLDGNANLCDLADSVYWWNDRVRRRWAFDFYDANPSAD